MKNLRLKMLAMAAVVAVSGLMMASVAGAAALDKLKIRDAGNAKDVLVVNDQGTLTVSNAVDADSVKKFIVNDASGSPTLTFSPDGFMTVSGANKAEFDNVVYYGDASGTFGAGVRPVFVGQRHRGSKSAPLAVRLNDKLGTFAFSGYDGAALQSGALLEVFVDGTPTATTYKADGSVDVLGTVPQRISLVTGSNPSARAERLVVKADGKLLLPGLLPVYTTNANAVAGGLAVGTLYRTGGDPDVIAIVHP